MTRRLVLSYLAVTVFVLLLLEVPLAVFYADRERERVAADLEHDATVIATIYEDALENDQPLDPLPAERYEARTGARTVVVNRAGVSLVDTAGPTDRDFSTRPEFARALHGEQVTGTRTSDTLATDILYVAVPAASGGVVHGAVRVTLDTGDVVDRIHRFWTALAVIAAVILALVALVGWMLARSVTRPVRRLQAVAQRFAAGDLTIDDHPPRGPPELRSLSEAMSTMAQRLDELLAAQRSFVADASHELRTPLTALRLRLENLQSHVSNGPSAELEAVIEETDRLRVLVDSLLQLARADARPAPATFDLARLTADRVDTWSAVADARDVRLDCEGVDQPTIVTAVPGAIEQILDNLLDNALNAAPAGSRITASVSTRDDRAQLRIIDRGPGLDDAHKAEAARRFWRGDPSHPGTGLGLAIVDTLATASAGSFSLHDTPGGGLTAITTFPLAGPARVVSRSRPDPARSG